MRKIPTTLTRVTKHKNPRYQVYQPGFNPNNSCYLNGDWVDVPKIVLSLAGWDQCRALHEALYADLHARLKVQCYRDEPTPIDQLTLAQRQAFEFSSGSVTPSIRYTDTGLVGLANVDLVGGRASADSIAWLRAEKAQVFRLIRNGDRAIDQTSGLGFPEDIIVPGDEVHDPWKHIVKQNRNRDRGMFDAFVEHASPNILDASQVFENHDAKAFYGLMAFTSLTESENSIIREEHYEQVHGKSRGFEDIEDLRREYAEKRRALELKFGDRFAVNYERSRATHNKCARTNLDNSDGQLYSYVLPKFHPDGTHEPWGPRDVPWNTEDDD